MGKTRLVIQVMSVAIFWLVATSLRLNATMLIVIYTPDGFWVGADSARSDGTTRNGTVCKVHETKFGLLLKGGASQALTESGDIYSTDKRVREVLESASNAQEFMAQIEATFRRDIEAEMAHDGSSRNRPVKAYYLKKTNFVQPIPSRYASLLERDLSLFRPGSKRWIGEHLIVKPRSDVVAQNFITRSTYYRYSASAALLWFPIEGLESFVTRGDNGEVIRFPDSVHILVGAIPYEKSDAWVISHPKEALLEMLGRGHLEVPALVGPPYTIVHATVKADRSYALDWIQKGPCPSWTDTLNLESVSFQPPH